MKLFIWEGHGISAAYHDDGTLVVLADSPEAAREIVRAEKRGHAVRYAAYQAKMAEFRELGYRWGTPEYSAALAIAQVEAPYPSGEWDGSEAALDREPDRIVAIDTPTLVAFNGGGYD